MVVFRSDEQIVSKTAKVMEEQEELWPGPGSGIIETKLWIA
jgi:hypothetical protein